MDRKKLYLTAAGIGAGLVVRSVLRRRAGENLYGRVVLITGARHGLGLALARQFAAEGCKLAICDQGQAELDLVRQNLEAKRAHVLALRCDVTNLAQVDGMVEAVLERYGGIDILVNNAGAEPAAAKEQTLADIEQVMEARFWGVVYPTRAVLPHMLERRAGRIVNITSNGGHIAAAHLWPQDCAMFAAIGFSEGLRAELLTQGITVITVAPERLSVEDSRAARQILTATVRGEANGMSPRHQAKVLELVGDLLPEAAAAKTSRRPVMSALAILGRMAARRYLQP